MGLLHRIQMYGDSILKGVELDTANRYIVPRENSWQFLEEEYPLAIVNRAKFGCTVTKGLEQLRRAADKGLSCEAVVLEYGGNDCDYRWPEISANPTGLHEPNTPLPEFIRCCREMISILRENRVMPIVMSLPPIDAQRYFDWFCRDGLDRQAFWNGWAGMSRPFTAIRRCTPRLCAGSRWKRGSRWWTCVRRFYRRKTAGTCCVPTAFTPTGKAIG